MSTCTIWCHSWPVLRHQRSPTYCWFYTISTNINTVQKSSLYLTGPLKASWITPMCLWSTLEAPLRLIFQNYPSKMWEDRVFVFLFQPYFSRLCLSLFMFLHLQSSCYVSWYAEKQTSKTKLDMQEDILMREQEERLYTVTLIWHFWKQRGKELERG